MAVPGHRLNRPSLRDKDVGNSQHESKDHLPAPKIVPSTYSRDVVGFEVCRNASMRPPDLESLCQCWQRRSTSIPLPTFKSAVQEFIVESLVLVESCFEMGGYRFSQVPDCMRQLVRRVIDTELVTDRDSL
jgi:hypothetical protein